MKNLLKLLSILELSKEQSLTGFYPAGLKRHEVPSLAEHHYTSAMMAMFLGQKIVVENPDFDTNKLLKMVLIHDLSEIFGGDIAGPLSRKYPDLREHKDEIGRRAIDMLSDFLDEDKKYLIELWEEFEFAKSDEVLVGKLIDQMDHQFTLEHYNHEKRYNTDGYHYREDFVGSHVFNIPEKIVDERTRKVCTKFVDEFKNNFYKKGYQAINFLMQ
jgi:5'-deoxynucleotidase YfbR-like HD superfamily hydrolase